MQNTLDFPDAGVQLADGKGLRGLDYAGDLVCLSDSVGRVHCILDTAAGAEATFSMRRCMRGRKLLIHLVCVASLGLDGAIVSATHQSRFGF